MGMAECGMIEGSAGEGNWGCVGEKSIYAPRNDPVQGMGSFPKAQ